MSRLRAAAERGLLVGWSVVGCGILLTGFGASTLFNSCSMVLRNWCVLMTLSTVLGEKPPVLIRGDFRGDLIPLRDLGDFFPAPMGDLVPVADAVMTPV